MTQYMRLTRELVLRLGADNLTTLHWWVDGSCAIHDDMKGHTGGALSMGKGVIYGTSTRQKLNTRSSTEEELVAVDDCMAQVLWTKYFLAAQGYETSAHVILQDNESAIRLETNGHKSMGQRSRHIEIRYFFITDQVNKGNVIIEYCPTDEMEGDYMSKALQGSKFGKFQSSIMNNQDSAKS